MNMQKQNDNIRFKHVKIFRNQQNLVETSI